MGLPRAEIPRIPLSVAITLICLAASPAIRAQVPTSPAHFVGSVPCRLADTRDNGFSGQYGPPALAASVPRNFMLTGQCGIPATAQAVSLNVTATNTQGPGFILIHPQGESQPVVSTLNYVADQTVANAAIVSLGTGGGITVVAGVSGTDLVLDTNGYFLDADIEFKGAWASGTTYGVNDAVVFGGATWVSLTSGNTGNQPDISPSHWDRFTGSFSSAAGTFDIITGGSTRLSVNAGGNVSLTGNLLLPDSTATAGNILKNGVPFLHNFGLFNTFVGVNAGNLNTTANSNTAVGQTALNSSTTGSANVAVGEGAMRSNTDGDSNSALGREALASNTTGRDNTAVGRDALRSNLVGSQNTAVGENALRNIVGGDGNTAVGYASMVSGGGFHNTAVGWGSLLGNTGGTANVAVGWQALASNNGNGNVAVGTSALLSSGGMGNIAVGSHAGSNLTSGDFNIYIGHSALATESNTIRIGGVTHSSTFIAGISGQTSAGGVGVLVNASGKLGTVVSSRHFKEEIADMGDASSGLLRLHPVTFRYKAEKGGSEPPRPLEYGLIAEEVEAVYPELVARSETGEPLSVRYHLLPAMLVNELQRQEREIASLREREAERERQIRELREEMRRLAEVRQESRKRPGERGR